MSVSSLESFCYGVFTDIGRAVAHLVKLIEALTEIPVRLIDLGFLLEMAILTPLWKKYTITQSRNIMPRVHTQGGVQRKLRHYPPGGYHQ